MRHMFAVAAILSFFAGTALAQEIDCANPQDQYSMTYCAHKMWEAADGDLNAAYQMARRIMKRLDANLSTEMKGGAVALRDAQRAWIAFRDKACEAEGFQARGGTLEPQIVYTCRERLTRQRTEDLRALVEEN